LNNVCWLNQHGKSTIVEVVSHELSTVFLTTITFEAVSKVIERFDKL
jgi:hypothetical protein